MKYQIKPNVNVVWRHDQTYSILRKLPTSLDGAYDLALIPALIIKNCLPCNIQIDLLG